MIKTIILTDFRNHKSSKIDTHGRHNVIVIGPNGAGKTAVLEAISMLSGDKGMRMAQMSDIARFDGTGGFSVFATLTDDSDISVYFNPSDSNRHARIDGDTATMSDLASRLRIIWITPREDRLFIDSATERRAFFDRLVTGFDTSHTGRIARLSKLLTERAWALKNGNDARWIDILDDQIAGIATAIASARVQYAGELNYFLTNCAVSVSGILETMLVDTSAATVERKYLDYLHNTRNLIGDKMVLDGPHKTDFGVFNNKLNLPANLTSTGQQKTTLLELILAHTKMIYTKTGHTPLILLDEAAAHLDAVSRHALFDALGAAHAQVWATGLDAHIFADVPDSVFVACADGEINNILVPEGLS